MNSVKEPTALPTAPRWAEHLAGGPPWRPWLYALGAVALTVALVTSVDLAPRVESDFFFATDDPQLAVSSRIEELFPTGQQLFLHAAGDPAAAPYLERLEALSTELAEIDGVDRVLSLVDGPSSPQDAAASPLWRRLLLPPDGGASYLVLELAEGDAAGPVTAVEEAAARAEGDGFEIRISGVPYVTELIRRHLLRDLRLFSVTALLAFGLGLAVLYRSPRVVLGTLASCLLACAATLGLLAALEIRIGLLTANLATIVFVLTLSHTIFLTSALRRAGGGLDAVAAALRETFPASFWCMTTTLLGFASLLLATARPMRELGLAGVFGTVVALGAGYLFYPVFLAGWHPAPGKEATESAPRRAALGPATATLAVVIALAAFGLGRLNTDPSLLSYFAPGSELRDGLEVIDAAGGSSPMSLVVSDPEGEPLDTEEGYRRMAALQEALEEDPAVGTTLSLQVILAEGKRTPLAALLSWRQLTALLSTPAFDEIARSFVTDDRLQAHFLLRMREAGREESRQAVVDRLTTRVREADLEPELVGGLYDLQGQLSQLVASSLLLGLGGLVMLFAIIAGAVSRRPRVAAAMLACLVATPAFLLGVLGHLRLPLDIIASPAANVAIALGIDSMIHLVLRARRLTAEAPAQAWAAARRQMAPPILGAVGVIATGFGLFALSSFPPTRHFGIAVVLGTTMAAALTLYALPWLAGRQKSRG